MQIYCNCIYGVALNIDLLLFMKVFKHFKVQANVGRFENE